MKTSKMSTPTTIIFDMDGIIFDTETMYLNCWRKIAAEHNIPNIDEAYRRVIGTHAEMTKKAYIDFYGPDFEYDKLNKISLEMFHEKEEKEGIPIKAGAAPLLEWLTTNNFNIGLASSTRTNIVKRQLTNAKLLDYFKVVVGGDMVKNSKPAPDIFLAALKAMETYTQTQIPAKETYAIEDSYNGVRAAHAAGMKVIMVPDIVKPDEEMKTLTTHICIDLNAVLNILSQPRAIDSNTVKTYNFL